MTGKIILVCIIVLIIAIIGTAFALWGNEALSLLSIRKLRERNDEHLDGAVYQMTVHGGFYLEDFIAQGGVSSDQELAEFVEGKITKGLMELGIKPPKVGCSSFTAKTPEGKCLFARNYDFDKTNTCIVKTCARKGRHATVSTVDLRSASLDTEKDPDKFSDRVRFLAAPYLPLDGINDAGVACGIYMSYQGAIERATDQKTDRPDLTSTVLLRMILDYADNVEEAIEIASSYDLHDSSNSTYQYMVADKEGNSAVLCWVGGKLNAEDNDPTARELVVLRGESEDNICGTDFQAVTNFVPIKGFYGNATPPNGWEAFTTICDTLRETNGIMADEKEAMKLLEKVGKRKTMPGRKNCTPHSAVYNLTDCSVLWVPNEHFDEKDAEITISLKPDRKK